MVGAAVICADTDEHAEFLSGPMRLGMARLRAGRPQVFTTPEEAAAHEWTPQELALAGAATSSHIVGSSATVQAGLDDLLRKTGVDEIMITTNVQPHADRVRSYELIAKINDPAGPSGDDSSAGAGTTGTDWTAAGTG
jgi:alkanesulfonate monooxygenase SsuD/methylene tetrahydromethanopterin reductase-like flavin-dependent oxidoreductase (luciferase family)